MILTGINKAPPQEDTLSLDDRWHPQGSGSWLRGLTLWPALTHHQTSVGYIIEVAEPSGTKRIYVRKITAAGFS